MRKVLSFFILTFICGILIFTALRQAVISMIDVTVYTFENKSIFKIAHNNDKSDSMLQDELYIPPTEVDDVINNGTKILSGRFDSFAYANNFAYLKIGNTYYVVDIANEVKNEYSDDEFSEMYPDYENFNWYDA